MNNKMLTLSDDYVLHHSNFESNGYRLFNIKSGKIYKLNRISFAIIEEFNGLKTTEQVEQIIIKKYIADEKLIKTDFRDLIEKLANCGILTERRQ